MTKTQHMNLTEWFSRMKEEAGVDRTKAVTVFNALTATQQQKIICRRWYRPGTVQPIERPLLPAA